MPKRLLPTGGKAAVLSVSSYQSAITRARKGQHGIRNESLLRFSFLCGLRVTEMAHLKVDDVVNKNGELKMSAWLPGSYSKTGRGRWLYLHDPSLRKSIIEYLTFRLENSMRTSVEISYGGLQPDSPLFLAKGNGGFSFATKRYRNEDGKLVVYRVSSSLQQLMTTLLKQVGIKHGSSHSGRRTFATRLADRGVEMEQIQLLLGHADVRQTYDYVEPNLLAIRRAMSQVYADI